MLENDKLEKIRLASDLGEDVLIGYSLCVKL